MKRSLNEIGGMVLKAARGAGVPLGHCDDIALAAAYLAATDPVRLDYVIYALAGDHDPAQIAINDDTMRIENARMSMAGPATVDAIKAQIGTVVLCDIDTPRLVLALLAAHGIHVDHRFDGPDLHITAGIGDAPVPPAHGHVTVSAILWDGLGSFAANTYVPASEASRLAGAGAGLNDND